MGVGAPLCPDRAAMSPSLRPKDSGPQGHREASQCDELDLPREASGAGGRTVFSDDTEPSPAAAHVSMCPNHMSSNSFFV